MGRWLDLLNTSGEDAPTPAPSVYVPIAPLGPIGQGSEARTTEPDDGLFDERAALVEVGARVPRPWAEEFARLDLRHRPPAMSPAEWRGILDDAGRFLDRYAGEAAALGWGPLDVFGVVLSVDGRQIGRRVGLAFLIGGGVVERITADRATVRAPSGSTLTYLRHGPMPPGAVALWEVFAQAQLA